MRTWRTETWINRALADAVERHATRDPGVRSILKRASAVSHPESESQKKIAMDTEQDPIPHPSDSHGGSSASGTRPSIATSADLNTDMTREVGAGPASDVTRASGEDHVGGDVVMREDENNGGHPSSEGSESRRRITTKREPREVRDERSSTTEHVHGWLMTRSLTQRRTRRTRPLLFGSERPHYVISMPG